MASAFREGGLCDRSGTFFYKDHLHKTNVPILALGGDQDLICPPEAVYGRRVIHVNVSQVCLPITHLSLVFLCSVSLHGIEQKQQSSFLNIWLLSNFS